MSTVGAAWPVAAAVALSLGCSLFGQAGNGAVYAIVPLVKKRVSGQVAGMAGAYGNVGALVFLSVLAVWGETPFFLLIAGASAVALVASRWLVEPAGSFAAELLVDDAVTDDPAPVAAGGAVRVDRSPAGPAALEVAAG